MRLIDADLLKRVICQDQCEKPDGCDRSCETMGYINDAPTIDAVEVVRCKDCRYGHATEMLGETCWHCGLTGYLNTEDGYCDKGMKRDA